MKSLQNFTAGVILKFQNTEGKENLLNVCREEKLIIPVLTLRNQTRNKLLVKNLTHSHMLKEAKT